MAKASSLASRIVLGLFMVVLFPTAAILVQGYLGAKSGQDEKEQSQKQNQSQNVVVEVHNHHPASAVPSSSTTPTPPDKSRGDDAKPSKEELGKEVQRPSPLPNTSRDLSGRWSGHWVDSGDGESRQGMFINERPNGVIVGGWCDGFKIQKGRRVGRDGILFESDDGSYQVAGRVESRGDRLLLLYTYTKSRPGSAVVGIHRLSRDGVNSALEPAAEGWSGDWSGAYANSLGNVGSYGIVLKDLQDGTIAGVWDDGSVITGRIIADGSVCWEQTQKDKGLYRAVVRRDGNVLRTSYTVTYSAGSGLKGFKGVEWFVRGKLPRTPSQFTLPALGTPPEPEGKTGASIPEPNAMPNLSGRWIGVSKGIFDVKQEGEKVSWRGRSSDGGKEWINVFHGRLTKKGDSYVVVGEWKDVPPGNYTGRGNLTLMVEGADLFSTIAETGGYGGTVWKRQKQEAPQEVTLQAVNDDPGKFDGQTLTVRGKLSGTLYDGSIHYRLTVQGAHITADGERIRKKGINFVIQKDQKETLTEGLKEDNFYSVKLTVTIKQLPKGFWIAVVSKVERE